MNSHANKLTAEIPTSILNRLLEKQEIARYAIANGKSNIEPIEYDWEDIYDTLHEYAKWFPQRFGAMKDGRLDLPGINTLKTDLQVAKNNLLHRALIAKDLDLLDEYAKQCEQGYAGMASEVFAYELSACFLSPYYNTFSQAFCDAVWEKILSATKDPKALFEGSVFTNQPTALVVNFSRTMPAAEQAEIINEALSVCMTYQHNHDLTLALNDILIQMKYHKPREALLMACDEGDLLTVKFLLQDAQLRRKLNKKLFFHWFDMTPLVSAIRATGINGSNADIVAYLLEQDADVLAECEMNQSPITAISQAVYTANKTITFMLLAHHIKSGRLSERTTDGFNILHLLCDAHRDRDNLDGNCWFNQHDINYHYHTYVSMLLDAGMDVNEKTTDTNYSPLYLAAQSSDIDTVRVLVKANADVSAVTATGKTVLFGVTDVAILTYLIENNVSVLIRDDRNRTALTYLLNTKPDHRAAIHQLLVKSIVLMFCAIKANAAPDAWIAYWDDLHEWYDFLSLLEIQAKLRLILAVATWQPLKEIKRFILPGGSLQQAIAIAAFLQNEEALTYLSSRATSQFNIFYAPSRKTPDDEHRDKSEGEHSPKRRRKSGD